MANTRRYYAFQLLEAQTATSTATGTGVDVSGYDRELYVSLSADSASAGTTPTLNVKLQESADDSTYTDITSATFTEVTGTAGTAIAPSDADGTITLNVSDKAKYIRAVATIGGTSTPTFEFCVIAFGTKIHS